VGAAIGHPLVLRLHATAVQAETPAQREARERCARQAAAEADIAVDPLVRALQENFDAEIVPDSIRRIE
jgi:hypothetical protein